MRVLPVNNCILRERNTNNKRVLIQGVRQTNYDTFTFCGTMSLSQKSMKEISDLKVLTHHIYEYKKGIRPLFLETVNSKYKRTVQERLERDKIAYVIQDINKGKNINVFFGEKPCVDVVKTLNPNLSEHTPQEDFILGTLLGYDKVKQCSRYLEKCERFTKKPLE